MSLQPTEVSTSNISSECFEWRSIEKRDLSLSRVEKVVSTDRYAFSPESGIANKTTVNTSDGFGARHRTPHCDNPIANDNSVAECPRANENATSSNTFE